jgi:hypothetical protein
MSAPSRRRRVGAALVGAGSLLGLAAGVVQATVGSRIPAWSGAKAEPVALGALTMALSAVAAAGAVLLRWPRLRGAALIAPAALVILPAVVCFTTVGRLWFVPGPLMLAGIAVGVDEWPAVGLALGRNWSRVLLAVLGCCQLLMAVRARPSVAVLGLAGGVALIAAACIRSRRWTIALAAVGTLPFAATAWTALVPLLVLLIAVPLAVGAGHRRTLPHIQVMS